MADVVIINKVDTADHKNVVEVQTNTRPVLPAMGYGDRQIKDLEDTINQTPVDMVIIATPIDLGRLININLPSQRVRYQLQEIGLPTLTDLLRARFELLGDD